MAGFERHRSSAGLPENVVREVALHQPQAHIVLDVGPGSTTQSPEENRFAAAVRLVRCETDPVPGRQEEPCAALSAEPRHKGRRGSSGSFKTR